MAILRSVSSNEFDTLTGTCTKPPGTAPNDVLIAFQTSAYYGDIPMVAPTGGGAVWRFLGTLIGSDWAGTTVWWKTAGSSEPPRYTFRRGEFGEASVVAIAAISDTDGATPRIAFAVNGDDNLVGCPALIATSAAGVTLRWAAAASNNYGTWTTPTGHTPHVNRTIGSASAALASRSRPVAGSTGAATFRWDADLDIPPTFSHGFTVDVGGTPVPPPEPEPSIPPSKDIHYRYKFCDLLTDVRITDLDLSDVSYDRRIGEPGTFSATIPIPSAEVAEKVAAIIPRYPEDLSTGPGRTVVHVYRNGIVWGTYLIWSASIAMSERGGLSARIDGATLESYLDHVEIREDLIYDGDDQLEIAAALIDSMQAQSHADLGLTVESATSGVPRDAAYLASETSTYGGRLKELAELDDGFEFAVQTSDPGTGTRTREVQLGYPRLGSADTEHLFTQPGNVISWQEDIDALRGGTSVVAQGESDSTDLSTDSGPTLSAPHNAAAHFAAGWPRLDAKITAHFVRDTDTLDDYAARWAAANAGAVRVHQVTIRLDGDDFTPANLGDQARVVLVNNWWPRLNGGASFDRSWRVIGISVQATTRGQRETAQLVFEEVSE